MHEFTITVRGIEFRVCVEFSYSGEMEGLEIYADSDDLTGVLKDSVVDEIQQKVLDSLPDGPDTLEEAES